MSDALWIIAIGSLVGISTALVGVFLVLRRLSMLGDAISHSVLLGIILAFLLLPSRIDLLVLLSAGLIGLLTAFITNVLNRQGRLQEDASIGVTFTFLFATGVILTSLFARDAHIDTDCILFGEIAFTPLDTLTIAGRDIGPRAFWILSFVTVINLLLVVVGYRSLKVITFDPVLASTLGISVSLWHYLMMAAVSMTTVASFESVGAILVVAMLVIPANAAYLIARSLSQMIYGAIIIAILSSIGGYALAAYFDASISAAMVLVSGTIFIILLFLSKLTDYRGALASPEIS
jgi:manganese/zinc/iron transport system permease protein